MDNRLLPFDAERFQPSAPAYPAWMSGEAARGIGTSYTPEFNQKYNPEIRGVDPRYAQYASQPNAVQQASYSPVMAQPADTGPIDYHLSNGGSGGENGGSGAGGGGTASNEAGGNASGYGPNQGQYGGSLSDYFGGSSSGGGFAGLGDPFGGRAPTSQDLGTYGPALFAGGMAALGPVGMIGTVANTVAHGYNTAMNAQALDIFGNPMSLGQKIGGVLGLPGNSYGGSLPNAIGGMMASQPDYKATQASQQPGPSATQVAAANVDNPTNPIDPTVAVTQEPMANPGDLSKGAPETFGKSGDYGGVAKETSDPEAGKPGGGWKDTAGPGGASLGGGFDNQNGTGGDSNTGGGGSNGGGGGGDNNNGGSNNGGGDTSAGPDHAETGGHAYMGGFITKNRLIGPNPPGPDDGFIAMQTGEGVMTRAAMAHYGPDFLKNVNRLLVPKNDNDARMAVKRGR